jgi:hypothetical protein
MGIAVVMVKRINAIAPAIFPVVFMKDRLESLHSFIFLLAQQTGIPVDEQR